MSGLRGFGMVIDLTGGGSRQWYAGADGVKRWADTDEPFAERDPDARRSQRDDAYIAELQKIAPPMRPDELDVIEPTRTDLIYMNNEDISKSKSSIYSEESDEI